MHETERGLNTLYSALRNCKNEASLLSIAKHDGRQTQEYQAVNHRPLPITPKYHQSYPHLSSYKRAAAPRTMPKTPAVGTAMWAAAPVLVAAAEADEAAEAALREADDWTDDWLEAADD